MDVILFLRREVERGRMDGCDTVSEEAGRERLTRMEQADWARNGRCW